ncbi:MAG TPA: tetratricopeptide repeat protein [Pyrinomonadaceae bacterium]|nr:tetratricopeptide repeat protein [Pyrinomonadaceae bacterium]
MNKRRIIAVVIAFLLTIAATAVWSASSIEREGDPDANVLEDSGSEAGVAPEGSEAIKSGGGNKVVKVLKAPFKMFGRLFGRGGDHKFKRMTEEDAEKFASVGVARVEVGDNKKYASITGSAREHLEAGRQHLIAGRYNEAIAELSTAASLDPKLSEAHNLLGVAYNQKGFGDRAKESFERAVKNDPDDVETLNNLGFALYQNGNYRAAVDRLKRALKLAPTDERVLNNLGLALCRLGKWDEAYIHFERAGGPLVGSLNTAKMFERFAREDDAIRYYEKARQIDPNNSIALRRLADLYQRVGRTAESEAVRAVIASSQNANAASPGR